MNGDEVTIQAIVDGTCLATSEKCIRLWETTRPEEPVLRQRRARVAAEQLIDRLLAESASAESVLAGLAADGALDADVRRYAEQVARFRLHDTAPP